MCVCVCVETPAGSSSDLPALFLLQCVIRKAGSQASFWPPSILWSSPVIVRPSHVWWDYVHSYVRPGKSRHAFSASLCRNLNKMFPRCDAALMRNVRQWENNLQLCTSRLVSYYDRELRQVRGTASVYLRHILFEGFLLQDASDGTEKSPNQVQHKICAWNTSEYWC